MSDTVRMDAKEIPVLLDCDVLVLGAGTSGFPAAVSSARAGVAPAKSAISTAVASRPTNSRYWPAERFSV